MNRRQSTTVAISVAALLGLSSLAACGPSSSASAAARPLVGGNVHEHEAHRGVDEGSIVEPALVKPSEHLAHQGR